MSQAHMTADPDRRSYQYQLCSMCNWRKAPNGDGTICRTCKQKLDAQEAEILAAASAGR